jgi:arylsulfatase A-like enzyme
MQQMTLQLDRRLETLLAQLKAAPGDGAFNLVLAAAHGAPPAPPEESRARMAVDGEALARALERSLAAAGRGIHVEKYLYPFLYLNPGSSPDPEQVRLLAGRLSLEQPGVAGFLTARGASSALDEWARRFRNSFHPLRCGDVMLSYRPEYVEDYGQNRGVSYGSLYNYDVRVPLCFYGPQFRAGAFETPVESVDVAPTLARAMGIAAPSSSMGRVLAEAFAT